MLPCQHSKVTVKLQDQTNCFSQFSELQQMAEELAEVGISYISSSECAIRFAALLNKQEGF